MRKLQQLYEENPHKIIEKRTTKLICRSLEQGHELPKF